MKYLIVGANGFLGRELVEHFKGVHEIKTLSFRPGNQTDFKKIYDQLIKNYCPDVIINAGASQTFGDKYDDISDLVESNICLPAILASGIKHNGSNSILINIGSVWEDFNGIYSPFNAYAASKKSASIFLEHFALDGVKVVHLKLSDTYGENDKRNKVLNLVLNCLEHDTLLKMSGCEQIVNFIHVVDVISGIEKAIDIAFLSKNKVLHSYSLVSNKSYQLKEIVIKAAEIYGKDIESLIEFGFYPYRNRERFEFSVIDVLPGWEAQISILDWLKNRPR